MLENVALPTLIQSLPSYSDLVPDYNSPMVIIKKERIGLIFGERNKLTICSSHSFLSQNTLKVYFQLIGTFMLLLDLRKTIARIMSMLNSVSYHSMIAPTSLPNTGRISFSTNQSTLTKSLKATTLPRLPTYKSRYQWIGLNSTQRVLKLTRLLSTIVNEQQLGTNILQQSSIFTHTKLTNSLHIHSISSRYSCLFSPLLFLALLITIKPFVSMLLIKTMHFSQTSLAISTLFILVAKELHLY